MQNATSEPDRWVWDHDKMKYFRASSIERVETIRVEPDLWKIVAFTKHGNYFMSAGYPFAEIEEVLYQVMETILGHEI